MRKADWAPTSTAEIIPYHGESDMEREARLTDLADAEREAAYAACSKAITSFRWWGITNIVLHVRMWITAVRLRLGQKLWP